MNKTIEGRPLNRDHVLSILRAHREPLKSEHGIQSLSLFGSMARNEANPNSDIDLLVEFNRLRRTSLFDVVGAAQYIEKLLEVPEGKVDLVIRDAVIPELRDAIYGEAIDVFAEQQMEVSHTAHS